MRHCFPLLLLAIHTARLLAQHEIVAEQIRDVPLGSRWNACASVSASELMFAADEGRVVLYDLATRTFSSRRLPRNIEVTSVAVRGDGLWFTGTADGSIWTSGDRGVSWTEWQCASSRIVKILVSAGSVLVVAEAGMVYADPTRVPSVVTASFPGQQLYDASEAGGRIAIVGSRGFVASGGADGWDFETRVPPDTIDLTSVLRLGGDTLVVGGMKGRLLVSFDDGRTWAKQHSVVTYTQPDTGQYDRRDRAYALAIDTQGRIYVAHDYMTLGIGSGQGMCRYVASADGGTTWDVGRLPEESSDGAMWGGIPLRIAHRHIDGTVFLVGSTYATGASALYRTRAEERAPRLDTIVVTLEEPDTSFGFPTLTNSEMQSLAVSAGSLYALRKVFVFWNSLRRVELLKSLDTGRTWQSIDTLSDRIVGLAGDRVSLYAVDASCTVLRSFDDGLSWDTVFVLTNKPAFARGVSVMPVNDTAIVLSYAFAGLDTTRQRFSTNAVLCAPGVELALPTPPRVDSVAIGSYLVAGDGSVWYLASGRTFDSGECVSFVCALDPVGSVFRFWRAPDRPCSTAVRWSLLLVRPDSVLISHTKEMGTSTGDNVAVDAFWLNPRLGEWANVDLLDDKVRASNHTVDALDFDPEIALVQSFSILHVNETSGRLENVGIVGNSDTRVMSTPLRTPVKIGREYRILGQAQRVIAVRRRETISSVHNSPSRRPQKSVVFPNPVQRGSAINVLDLPSGPATFVIVDALGRERSTWLRGDVSTAGLAAGLYFLRISRGREVQSVPFVVE